MTDVGVKEPASLTGLVELDLRATGVTDASLKELVELKGCRPSTCAAPR